MLRRFACCAVAALAFAPVARADGPAIGATQGWLGVASPRTGERYVTISGNGQTTLEAIRMRDGAVFGYISFRGFWGVPAVTYDGTTTGISADGRVLVLEDGYPRATLRKTSSFLVVNVRRMERERVITLRGDFLVDAVSPNGRMLYLIQHVQTDDLTRYKVRAYDLRAGRLLHRVIADRSQRGWVMQGVPLLRATSSDGRWAYTLYQNPGGYPFVHALDTVRGTAHCVGIPWHGVQDDLYNLRLSLRDGGRVLAFNNPNGKRLLAMDTRTFRLSYPVTAKGGHGGSSFPWWWLGIGSVILALLLVAAMHVRSLSRGPDPGEVAAT